MQLETTLLLSLTQLLVFDLVNTPVGLGQGVFPPVESAMLAVLASLGALQYYCLNVFSIL